jgi:CHASE2 domain-containing sensor protein
MAGIVSRCSNALVFLAKSTKASLFALGGATLFLSVYLLVDLPHGPEHWSADLRTLLFSKNFGKQYSRIALIEITDATMKSYPYLSPIDRHLLAKLIQAVDTAGPKAIGLDIIFDRATEPCKDLELQQAIEHASKIVLGALDEDTLSESAREIQNQFLAKSKSRVGHLYLGEERGAPFVISNHVIRKIAKQSGDRLSFAEVLAKEDDGPPHDKVDEGRWITWLKPPKEDKGLRSWISPKDWRSWFTQKGNVDTFLTLPADLLLERDQDGSLGKLFLHDRFVLIGGNFADRDQHLTPFSVWTEARFNGLYIQAQILRQLLENEHLHELSWPMYIPIILAVIALGVWMGYRDRTGHGDLWKELVIVVTLILTSFVAFIVLEYIFPFVSVFVGLSAGIAAGHSIKPAPQAGHSAGGS